MSELITVRDLRLGYGAVTVLRDVNLSLQQGERLLLLGPNGAGKSTLLRAMAGLTRPWAGTVTSAGTAPASRLGRPGGIGCLLQTGNAAEALSVRDNLLLAGWHLPRRQRFERAEELLTELAPLNGLADRMGALLSGGERQCLALAMTLMPSPSILLLDEPTAGLSPIAGQEMMALVQACAVKEWLKAVVLVEHRLDLALPFATRVIGLNSGKPVWESSEPMRALADPSHLESLFFADE